MPDIKITHDATLDIATGKSRKETSWKNKPVPWSVLVQTLSKTHRTHETHAAYMAGNKDYQDSIKDVGGFVGGYLAGGRRSKTTVLHRSLITLDIDYGRVEASVWESFKLLYECAAVVYSTHKHSPAHPRLRLIIPLDREVPADQYQAIARRIAGDLDINQFDPTTFQPERLMYWPSTAMDGEYFFDYLDAPFVSANTLLGTYRNWADSSEWPFSEKESRHVERIIKKQEDPTGKRGLVGAFCRCYTMTEAIETFLSAHYGATDDPARYTYLGGSTGKGLIIYDDLFAFSHHGTDPASMTLCNAFDLVRLHLYGARDEDSKESGVKLPSYKAMMDFIGKDPNVRALQATERLEGAQADFGGPVTGFEELDLLLAGDPDMPVTVVGESGNIDGDIGDVVAPVDADGKPAEWLKDLEIDNKGQTANTINNIVLILENDGRLKGRIWLDQFSGWAMFKPGRLPWRLVEPGECEMADDDEPGLRHFLERCYGISHKEKTRDALDIILRRYRAHPVRDYLGALVWDEVDRVETILIDYLGAEDTEYNRAVMKKMVVAAVARVYEPGIKYDDMLVLSGPQGCGKSTLFARLGRQWFTDNFSFHMLTGHGVRAQEQIAGHWIIEAGEMSGMGKADLEATKSFLRSQVDNYRGAYGRKTAKHPRQCIIVGSTNKDKILRDRTGNRSFDVVPVMVNTPQLNIFKDFTREVVNQVWAEAVRMYRAGEKLTLPGYLLNEAAAVHARHMETDERAGVVEWFLNVPLPAEWDEMDSGERRNWIAQEKDNNNLNVKGVKQRDFVSAVEVWVELFGKNPADMTFYNVQFIHDIMKDFGSEWVPSDGLKKLNIHGRHKYYLRAGKNKSGSATFSA